DRGLAAAAARLPLPAALLHPGRADRLGEGMSRRASLSAAGGGLVGGLDALLHLVVRLVWLNLWWTLLTLRGGIVLGLGPAGVGAQAVASAWARGERDVDVRATMCARWRSRRRPA